MNEEAKKKILAIRNIYMAKIRESEIERLQSYIDAKPEGEYELSEILGSKVWDRITRKRRLGIIFRKKVREGCFRDIVDTRESSDNHIHYTIARS